MVISIPENQLCQVFDPMMILPEKTAGIISDPMNASTSCVAPASVYLEGTRGKRFLCDFHYEYERSITVDRTPFLWPDITQILVDERENIRSTFEDHNNPRTVFGNCWCDAEAFVKIIPISDEEDESLFCNFHFRKFYYRHLSNQSEMLKKYFDIIDDRKFMSMSIKEEAEQLTGL